MGKKDEHDGLKPVRIADVPLEEVSGICLRREVSGGMSLVAIGDRAAVITLVVAARRRRGRPLVAPCAAVEARRDRAAG